MKQEGEKGEMIDKESFKKIFDALHADNWKEVAISNAFELAEKMVKQANPEKDKEIEELKKQVSEYSKLALEGVQRIAKLKSQLSQPAGDMAKSIDNLISDVNNMTHDLCDNETLNDIKSYVLTRLYDLRRKSSTESKEVVELPMLEIGQTIKLYGKKTKVKGFEVYWNDALTPPQYEIILLTTGRGDPFKRSLDKIEII